MTELVSRTTRRALRAFFVRFRANNAMIGMTEVGFDVGEARSRLRGGFLADTAFYPTGQHGDGT